MSNTIPKDWLSALTEDKRNEFLTKTFYGKRPCVLILGSPEELTGQLEFAKGLGFPVLFFKSVEDFSRDFHLFVARTVAIASTVKFWQDSIEIPDGLPVLLVGKTEDALNGDFSKRILVKVGQSATDVFNRIFTQLEHRLEQIRDDYELLHSFLEDAVGLIETMETGLLAIENGDDISGGLASMFGVLHTVKGASGFFEPRHLHEVAHRFEDQIKNIQEDLGRLNDSVVSTWLGYIDYMKILLERYASGDHKLITKEEMEHLFQDISTTGAGPELEASADLQLVPATRPKEKKNAEAGGSGSAQDHDIKVSTELLDGFLQASGELTVLKNMINKTAFTLEKRYHSDKDMLSLNELLFELFKINSEIQSQISDVRKISVKQLVKPLHRVVRDTSKALGKRVAFIVEGDDLRIDHSVGEVLSHSLIHLMRNSIDHGIEAPSERGLKDPEGKIKISFFEEADTIVTRVSDDGKGIDGERLKLKALENGLIKPADVDSLSSQVVLMLIFESGFSTAKETTEFSGRGVGMSMVKDSVESKQGKISVQSELGSGTTFEIRIPSPKSALIEKCLFVQAGEQIFGLPQGEIERVLDVALNRENIVEINQSYYLNLESLPMIPLVWLSECLSGQLPRERFDGHLLVVSLGRGERYALIVETLHELEDSVIKPLDVASIRRLGVYLGATFLSDGSVGMVIDLKGLAKRMALQSSPQAIGSVLRSDPAAKGPEQNLERWMTFYGAKAPGTFALLENILFRIEEVAAKDLQWVGNSSAYINYNDSLLRIVDFDEHFESSGKRSISKGSVQSEGRLILLILRSPESLSKPLVGVLVREVGDLIEVPKSEKNLNHGATFLFESTVMSVFNPADLFEEEKGANLHLEPIAS